MHRNYNFRNLNYANKSLISVDIEGYCQLLFLLIFFYFINFSFKVGNDNHAVLYVTLNELIDPKQKFYACDVGCIDPPIELELHKRKLFFYFKNLVLI